MKITRIDLLRIRVPFRLTFRHSLAARSVGENVLVRMQSDDGRAGYGECVPRTYVTGESIESVWRVLSDGLGVPLSGVEYSSFDQVVDALRELGASVPRDQQAAFCALELAALDLAGRCFGVSAGQVVGPVVHDDVFYSAVLSADGMEAVLKTCAGMKRLGFQAVKLKVGADLDANVKLMQAVREALGSTVSIRVDVNCAWTLETALKQIEALVPFGLDAVEQPLPQGDMESLAALTARSPVRIILDESIASVDDAVHAIEAKACHCFNIRVSKCGGLLRACEIRDLAAAADLDCMLGAQVGETALLSAAGRHIATRSQGFVFLEGSYGALLLEHDIGREDLTIGPRGRAGALSGPGLGVDVDTDLLADVTEEESRVR